YQEYLAVRSREAISAKEAVGAARVENRATTGRAVQAAQKEARRQTQALKTLENRIAELEALQSQHERELQQASEWGLVDDVRRLAEAHAAGQAELETLLQEWVALEQ
ncbi:MAG: ABC transporter C-terminal domain-containing protein, partial [Chloroflexota bacterium]